MRGNVTRRGPDTWRLRIYLGTVDGRQRFLSRTIHGTEDQAHQALAKLLVEVGDGHHRTDGHTVHQLLDGWLELVAPDLSPSTLRDYRYAINRHIQPGLGHRPIARLSPAELDRWYRTLPCGPARTRRIHNILSAALDQAIRWQWLVVNPCDHARPPKITQREIDPPSPDDVARLHALAQEADPDLATFVHVAARTGARRGELVALTWSDIDLDRASIGIRRSTAITTGGTVTKTTKTDHERVVAIGPATVAVLKAHRARQAERALAAGARTTDGPVFTSDPEGTRPWYPDSVSRRFRNLRDQAGLPGVRLHDLRHYVATQLLARGADYRTVAGRLGHRQPATLLNRYAHFVSDADRAAADLLED